MRNAVLVTSMAIAHLAIGATDAGRKLTVAFIYFTESHTAYPITAWERS
jgi:hypothetical protein